MKLYKYCSIKAGLEIIRKSRVLLSNPSNFNDPFDSIFDIEEKEVEKAKAIILNYGMFKGLYKTFCRNDLKLSNSLERAIINNLKKEFQIYRRILLETKKYEMVPSLNSSLKRLSNINDVFKTKIEKVYTKFEQDAVDPLKMVAKQALISCFSKIPDSILMWSHYANSHKGICIEIEEERSDFRDVIYSKKRAKFDFNDLIKRILAADYLETSPNTSDNEYNYKILKPFFTKSDDWAYEKEVRCVVSGKNPTIEGFEIDDCLPFLDVNITKIYIGINTKDDDLNEILKLAYHRGIPVVYMEKHPTDFALIVNENRSVKPVYKNEQTLNPVELLFQEMERCLDNNLYLPALFIGLSLPGIIASVVYPNLTEFDGYVKVFRETYESYLSQEEPGTPYICGELCYELQKSLISKGTIEVPNHIKNFDLEKVELKTVRKKNLDIFISCIATVTHADGSMSNSIDLNIREYCIRFHETCSKLLLDHKSEFDSMPKIEIFDIDKEHEDMVECSVHTKTINEQILKYAKLKSD